MDTNKPSMDSWWDREKELWQTVENANSQPDGVFRTQLLSNALYAYFAHNRTYAYFAYYCDGPETNHD